MIQIYFKIAYLCSILSNFENILCNYLAEALGKDAVSGAVKRHVDNSLKAD